MISGFFNYFRVRLPSAVSTCNAADFLRFGLVVSRFARHHPELEGSRLTQAMLEETHSELMKSAAPAQHCPQCHQPVFVIPADAPAVGPCLSCIQQAAEQ